MIHGAFSDLDEQQIAPESLDMVFPTCDPSYNKKLTRDLAVFSAKFLRENGFLVMFTKPAAGDVAYTVKKYAKNLKLLNVFQVYYSDGPWLNFDDNNPKLNSPFAVFLIFWKGGTLSYEKLDFNFDEQYSINAMPADEDRPLITAEECNKYVIEDIIKLLNLEYAITDLGVGTGIVCDPTCEFGDVGEEVVRCGFDFLGIEEDAAKFKIAMRTMQDCYKDIQESQEVEEQVAEVEEEFDGKDSEEKQESNEQSEPYDQDVEESEKALS